MEAERDVHGGARIDTRVGRRGSDAWRRRAGGV